MTTTIEASLQKEQATSGTIIIVEDDPDNAEFLQMALTGEFPYSVLLFRSGMETLQQVELIQQTSPILFLLDFTLPIMTAINLYDQLHGMSEFEHVPAIIISASGITKQIEEDALERNIPILPKPFSLDELFTHIKKVIEV